MSNNKVSRLTIATIILILVLFLSQANSTAFNVLMAGALCAILIRLFTK